MTTRKQPAATTAEASRAPRGRARAILLAVLAVASFYATFLLFRGPRAPAPRAGELAGRALGPHEGALRSEPRDPPPTTVPLTAAGPARDGNSAAPALLVVEVASAGTLAPIEDADVALVSLSPLLERTGCVFACDLRARAVTDARGRVVFREAPLGEGLRLVVTASDHVGETLDLVLPQKDTLRMVLTGGAEIRGRVVDVLDRAVPHLEVEAIPADRPQGLAAGDVAQPPAALQRSTTDDAGVFVLRGLTPRAQRLAVRTRNYRVVEARRDRRRGSVLTTAEVEARPGDDVVLVVVPIRMLRVRLVDAETGEPLAASFVTARAVPREQQQPTWLSGGARSAPSSTALAGEEVHPDAHDPAVESGLLEGGVDLDPREEPPRNADLEVQAEGYVTAHAVVPLREPELARSTPPDEVALTPARAGGVGTLLIPRPSREKAWAGDGNVLLSVCRPLDGQEVHLVATPVAGRLWEFRGVPAGDVRLRLHDGFSTSETVEVRLRPEETREIDVTLPPPTGLVLHCLDAGGRRVFDADIVLLQRAGETHALANAGWITRMVPGTHGPRDVLIPLEPGTWRVVLFKHGFSQVVDTFTVSQGAVTTRLLTLRRDTTRGEVGR